MIRILVPLLVLAGLLGCPSNQPFGVPPEPEPEQTLVEESPPPCEADLLSSAQHCGACGNACLAPANAQPICESGVCRIRCDPGYTPCASSCCKLPTRPSPPTISGGPSHSCAVVDQGGVKCWGENSSGQLGNGLKDAGWPAEPVATSVVGLPGKAVSVAAGQAHTCALLEDGKVACWGDNSTGKLGNGTYVSSPTPVLVEKLSNIGWMAAGAAHTCAIEKATAVQPSQLWCWGWSSALGTADNLLSPQRVEGLEGAVSVAAGYAFTCAVMADGRVLCWGRNSYGQLGVGTRQGSGIPTEAKGISTAIHVTASGDNVCAVLADGTVQCWGQGQTGYLGNGSTFSHRVPVSLVDFPLAAGVYVGRQAACAHLRSGELACWAAGSYGGALGDGPTSSNTPLRVLSTEVNKLGLIELSTGGNPCGKFKDGTIRCWGMVGLISALKGSYAPIPMVVKGI